MHTINCAVALALWLCSYATVANHMKRWHFENQAYYLIFIQIIINNNIIFEYWIPFIIHIGAIIAIYYSVDSDIVGLGPLRCIHVGRVVWYYTNEQLLFFFLISRSIEKIIFKWVPIQYYCFKSVYI